METENEYPIQPIVIHETLMRVIQIHHFLLPVFYIKL